MHRLAAFLGLAALLTAATAADSPKQPNPLGFPKKVTAGGGVGVYRVWFDDDGWHLRTSTEDSQGKKEKLLVFTGSVRCEDKVTVEGKLLEKGNGRTADTLTPHRDGKGFDFRFATYGAKDQADFRPGPKGKQLKFKLFLDGEKMHPSRVFIGADGDHPEKEEFALPASPTKKKE